MEEMKTVTVKEWMAEARKIAKKAGKDGMALDVSRRAKHLVLAAYDDYIVTVPAWKLRMRGCA